MLPGLTESQIITYAAGEGVRLTSEQLKRWRKAGVFPSPSRHGLGRGKGTISIYPDGADRWAVELARELETRRSLSAAAWGLWLKGYPLTSQARKQIDRALPRLVASFDRWARGEFDLKGALVKRGRKHPVIGVGARMLSGGVSRETDLREAWKLLGDDGEDPSREWLDQLATTGHGLSLQEWGVALRSAPDETLDQVRDEVLLGLLIMDTLSDSTHAAPSPLDILLWFGLSRVAPGGKSFLETLRSEIAAGHVPQVVSQLRDLLPIVRDARLVFRSVSHGRRREDG